MTREEARNIVTNADLSKIPGDVIEAFFCLCISNGKEGERYCNSNEAHRMAIKSLKEENTDDRHDVPSDEMTLEQARQVVKDLRKKLAEYLTQEPCGDAISRQAAQAKIKNICEEYNLTYGDGERTGGSAYAFGHAFDDLPSVTPKQKVGRWIEGKYRDDDIRYNDSSYKCNKCGRIVDFKENYCPDCGAKMEEELK